MSLNIQVKNKFEFVSEAFRNKMFRKKILEMYWKSKKSPNPFENILQHFLKPINQYYIIVLLLQIFHLFSLILSYLILHNKYMLMVN
jgi:hypothetical protein